MKYYDLVFEVCIERAPHTGGSFVRRPLTARLAVCCVFRSILLLFSVDTDDKCLHSSNRHRNSRLYTSYLSPFMCVADTKNTTIHSWIHHICNSDQSGCGFLTQEWLTFLETMGPYRIFVIRPHVLLFWMNIPLNPCVISVAWSSLILPYIQKITGAWFLKSAPSLGTLKYHSRLLGTEQHFQTRCNTRPQAFAKISLGSRRSNRLWRSDGGSFCRCGFDVACL